LEFPPGRSKTRNFANTKGKNKYQQGHTDAGMQSVKISLQLNAMRYEAGQNNDMALR
jgi:hypothetical protein